MTSVNISIDMMGGDSGLDVTVPGLVKALRRDSTFNVLLFGDEKAITEELPAKWRKSSRVEIINSPEVIGMGDSVSMSMVKNRDTSMIMALNAVKEGRASACLSAGNTAALTALSYMELRPHDNINRPAFVAAMPNKKNGVIRVMDLGASLNCSAEDLYGFARMGNIVLREIEQIHEPRIGVLNIGHEDNKGIDLVKDAATLIAADKNLNYVGFAEGDDVFHGDFDLIVCDGFVGNVMVKAVEGLSSFAGEVLKKNFFRTLLGAISLPLAIIPLLDTKRTFKPSQYNGAYLLGLNGVVVKSHGKTDFDGFMFAVQRAVRAARKQIPELIAQVEGQVEE